MATRYTYRSVGLIQQGTHVRCSCTMREQYLDALKVLATIHDWTHAEIGVLRCEVSGGEGEGKTGAWCYAHTKVMSSHNETMGLLPTVEVKTCAQARSKAIAHMTAWVKESNGFATQPGAHSQGEGTHAAGSDKTN